MHHADQLPVAQREKRARRRLRTLTHIATIRPVTGRPIIGQVHGAWKSARICSCGSTAFERSASLRTLRIVPPTRWDNTVAGRRADASGIAKFEVKRSSAHAVPPILLICWNAGAPRSSNRTLMENTIPMLFAFVNPADGLARVLTVPFHGLLRPCTDESQPMDHRGPADCRSGLFLRFRPRRVPHPRIHQGPQRRPEGQSPGSSMVGCWGVLRCLRGAYGAVVSRYGGADLACRGAVRSDRGDVARILRLECGALVAMLISRFMLRDWVQKRFGKQIAGINKGLTRDGTFYLVSLRLIPIVPFVLLNPALGLTRIKVWTFWWTTQLGMLPGNAIYVNAGEAGRCARAVRHPVAEHHQHARIAGGVPVIATRLLTYYKARKVYRGWRKPKRFDYNLVVIGGGAGGLATARIAATYKARVCLVERERLGGVAMHEGGVPTKAFRRLANELHTRHGGQPRRSVWRIDDAGPPVDRVRPASRIGRRLHAAWRRGG